MTQPNTFTHAELLKNGPAFLYYRHDDGSSGYAALSFVSEAHVDAWWNMYYKDAGWIRMTEEEVHTWEFTCRLRGDQ